MSDLLNSASLVMIPSGYKEDVVYSQIPTSGAGDLSFTRASSATRVNSAGLVEVCPWNLFGNSEDAPSGWGNVYNIASVTANSTTAPNGTNTGNLIVENSVNSTHWFEQSFTAINGTPYTLSVYFKAKERTQCALFGFADNGVFATQLVIFDLSNGTVVSQSGTQTNSITDAGGGWYRCAITLTSGASATGYFAYGLANGGSNSYQGNGTSGLYMWGRQLNTGTLKPYFPTTDRLNVPRLTYQNGGGGCPSLLLEKQSTNYIFPSEDFANGSYWFNSNGASATANQTTSPDGTQNADKITFPANSAANLYNFPTTVIGSNVFSIYAKTLSGTKQFRLRIDTGSGPAVSADFTATTTWQRFDFVCTTTAANLVAYIFNDSVGVAGDLYVWGAQLEASSYATSYIPTTSSSATRVADACFKTGISSLIGASEGTFFVDAEINFNADGTILASLQNTAGAFTNAVYWYITGSKFEAAIWNTPQFTGWTQITSTLTNGRHKVALAWKANDYAFYLNGTQVGVSSSYSAVPSGMSKIDLANYVASYQSDQKFNEVVVFPTRLTNAELASITSL